MLDIYISKFYCALFSIWSQLQLFSRTIPTAFLYSRDTSNTKISSLPLLHSSAPWLFVLLVSFYLLCALHTQPGFGSDGISKAAPTKNKNKELKSCAVIFKLTGTAKIRKISLILMFYFNFSFCFELCMYFFTHSRRLIRI